MTGIVKEWKGVFGWIQPTGKIDHPEAAKRKGKLYVGQEDVEADLEGVGASVSFFVYQDGTGLGAMNVRPSGKASQEKRQPQAPKTADKKKLKPAGDKKEAASGPPDKSKRKPVLEDTLISGKVVKVRGKAAFIKPIDEIDHPKGKGDIFLHVDDMQEGDAFPLVGAQVIFYAYEDTRPSLGAMQCQLIEQGDGEAELGEDAEADTTGRKRKKLRGMMGKQAAALKKREKTEKGPTGPDLARERVTTEKVMGELVDWKRNMGWIKPAEPVDHADAEKKGGKIYIHQKDITEGTPTEKGTMLSFHIYADESGLGAEEVSV